MLLAAETDVKAAMVMARTGSRHAVAERPLLRHRGDQLPIPQFSVYTQVHTTLNITQDSTEITRGRSRNTSTKPKNGWTQYEVFG